MKKISRVQKSRIIERVKTIVLVLLLLSCIFFGYQTFETYREQATFDNFWSGSGTSANDKTQENAVEETKLSLFRRFSRPTIILVNARQSRKNIDYNSKEFKTLNDAADAIINSVYGFNRESIKESQFAEWETAIKKNSVFLRYPASRSFDYESAFYNTKFEQPANKQENYDEILLVPYNNRTVTVFFRDRKENKILKVQLESASSASITEVLALYGDTNTKEYFFAHELNLDEDNSDKPLMDSMLLVNTEKNEANDIVVTVPKTYKTGLNFIRTTEFATNLLKIFGYNLNTVRQYVNNDDALIFVGETGSLSVYPEGKIEYKALDSKTGIAFSASDQVDLSSISVGACDLIEKILKTSGVKNKDLDFSIGFTQIPSKTKLNEKTEICFDYFIDGKKLVFGLMPAIKATFENGVLVGFEIQVRDIEKLGDATILDDTLSEIDKFYMANPLSKRITDGAVVYPYNVDNEIIKAKWQILGER